ncbi:hypothetical protein BC567DRAFT_265992 [Phyllosticta citribraziliensis]
MEVSADGFRMSSSDFANQSGLGASSSLGNHGRRLVISTTIITIVTTMDLDTGRTQAASTTTTTEERKVTFDDGSGSSDGRNKDNSATTGLDGQEPLVEDGGADANNDGNGKVETTSAKKRKRDRSRNSARKKAKTSRKEMRDLKGAWDWM